MLCLSIRWPNKEINKIFDCISYWLENFFWQKRKIFFRILFHNWWGKLFLFVRQLLFYILKEIFTFYFLIKQLELKMTKSIVVFIFVELSVHFQRNKTAMLTFTFINAAICMDALNNRKKAFDNSIVNRIVGIAGFLKKST